MKKSIKLLLAMAILLPLLFSSCQKSDIIEIQSNDNDVFLKDAIAYCGDPLVVNLISHDQTFNPGTVTVGNDADNLYVTYNTSSNMTNIALYVGQHSIDPNYLWDGHDPETGEIHYYYWRFPYRDNGPATTKMFTIPLTEVQSDDGCFFVISHAEVEGQTVSGSTNFKYWGWSFDYCLQECTPPSYDCETAYAYGDEVANCFIDIPGVRSNNWGWSNGGISEGTFSWDIYAGAGHCDIDRGTLVGTLEVEYLNGTATINYSINTNYTLDETHLFVGNEILPRDKKGRFTTAPGKFPYNGETTYTIEDLSGLIYIAAHAVVCGDFE